MVEVATKAVRHLTLGHSPDADDAFMFYGLSKDQEGAAYRFEHKVEDMETLNRRALAGELDVTAVSVHTFAFVAEKYGLLRCGASVGEGYGPRLVAKVPGKLEDWTGKRIAVPGALTTAALSLHLRLRSFEPVHVHFDRVFDVLEKGEVDAALVIHEGQLTFAQRGFHLIEDLGEWWRNKTGLPLPLGINVVRRDLGLPVARDVARALKASIERALREREKALDHASTYGRGVDRPTLDKFVGWYVNARTLDMGDEGLRSIQALLQAGAERGIIPALRPELLEALA